MKSDSEAVQTFLEGLRNLRPAPMMPVGEPKQPPITHITINRPHRCTIIVGDVTPKRRPAPGHS